MRAFQISDDKRVRWLIEDGEPLNTFIITVNGVETFRTVGDFDKAHLEFAKAEMAAAD